MTKLHKVSLLVFSLLMCGKLFAQNQLAGALYILHEGSMAKRGSVGYISLPAKNYQHIDSVAAFGNQLTLIGANLVLTDGAGNIRMYDTTTKTLLRSIAAGARSVAAYNTQLVVAANVAPYVRVLDANTGNTLYAFDTTIVKSSRESVHIMGNIAYITGFFNATDLVRLDLTAQTILPALPTAINNNWLAAIGNTLYIGCPNYTTNQTVIHALTNGAIASSDTLANAQTAAFACGNELVLKSFGTNAIRYTPNTKAQTAVAGTANAYVVVPYCAANDAYFYTVTDFSATGFVGFMGGNTRDSVATHISPRAVVFVPNTPVSISETALAQVRVYPNPTAGELHLELPAAGVATLQTLYGATLFSRSVAATDALSLRHLPAGMYLLSLSDENGNALGTLKIAVE